MLTKVTCELSEEGLSKVKELEDGKESVFNRKIFKVRT